MGTWSTVEHAGGVVVAAYANPPMNYLDAEGATDLRELVQIWADPAVRAVVLTGGVPGKFITHYSVEELLGYANDHRLLDRIGTRISESAAALMQALNDLPKPVVVAMTGDTMGGGFELALACDIRIAAAGDHRIGLPESRLGILPGGGGTQRLTRLIGPGRALELILRGRVVRPEEALALGLVHEVVDDAAARALELASELAKLSPVSMAQIKRAVLGGADKALAAGLAIEADACLATLRSAEAVTAMRAYLDLPADSRRAALEAGPLVD